MEPKSGDLKDRTYQFSLSIAQLVDETDFSDELGRYMLAKLSECSLDIGLLARIAFKGRGQTEFTQHLITIIQHAEACIYWLDMLVDLKKLSFENSSKHMIEASELVAIFISISKKSKNQF